MLVVQEEELQAHAHSPSVGEHRHARILKESHLKRGRSDGCPWSPTRRTASCPGTTPRPQPPAGKGRTGSRHEGREANQPGLDATGQTQGFSTMCPSLTVFWPALHTEEGGREVIAQGRHQAHVRTVGALHRPPPPTTPRRRPARSLALTRGAKVKAITYATRVDPLHGYCKWRHPVHAGSPSMPATAETSALGLVAALPATWIPRRHARLHPRGPSSDLGMLIPIPRKSCPTIPARSWSIEFPMIGRIVAPVGPTPFHELRTLSRPAPLQRHLRHRPDRRLS